MKTVVKGLVLYDHWCLTLVALIEMWLNDWLSLTQRRVEMVLIGIYVGAGICGSHGTTGRPEETARRR